MKTRFLKNCLKYHSGLVILHLTRSIIYDLNFTAKSAKDISGKEGLPKDIQQTDASRLSQHLGEEVDTNLLEKFQRAIEKSGRLCFPKDEEHTVSFCYVFSGIEIFLPSSFP